MCCLSPAQVAPAACQSLQQAGAFAPGHLFSPPRVVVGPYRPMHREYLTEASWP